MGGIGGQGRSTAGRCNRCTIGASECRAPTAVSYTRLCSRLAAPVARPPRSPPHAAGPRLRPLALQGEAEPQTKAEAVALQVLTAQEELRAAVEVLLAAALLPLQPRLLVQPLQAALEGFLGAEALLPLEHRMLVQPLQAALEVFLGAEALLPLQHRLLLQPLQAAAPQLLLAPQAASSLKAEGAWAAPITHICLLGNPHDTGSKCIYALDT